jgi:hypothetical protein
MTRLGPIRVIEIVQARDGRIPSSAATVLRRRTR